MMRTPRQIMEAYLIDVAQNGRLDLIDDIALPDMVDEANQAFGGPPGRAGLVAHVKGFRRALDSPTISIRDIVASDDCVMAWWTFTGKHKGKWLGRDPDGQALSGDVFSFFDLKDGKISRYRLFVHARFTKPVTFDSGNPEIPGV
ncbi:MAG: ester cyclase [Arenibacterium sp.]